MIICAALFFASETIGLIKEFLVFGKAIFSEILSLIHFFMRISSSSGDAKNIFFGKLALLE